jgi:UDP-glucose 6-dehydrogenase
MKEFRVGAVGADLVGNVMGASLVPVAHRVVCQDADEGCVAPLKEGRIPTYEPGLEELVAERRPLNIGKWFPKEQNNTTGQWPSCTVR